MKGFAQYLNEAEEHSPLSLNEAIEWFGVFYEELDDDDRSFVIDNLTEEDLYNILWLEEYLIEAELVPGAANKVVPFGKGKFKKGKSQSSAPGSASKQSANPNQYSQPAGPQRGTSDLKISKSGLEAAADVARNRESSSKSSSTPPPTKQSLKQSVKNFGSNVKSVAGKVYNAPETIGTKVGTAANKQLQKVPGVRKAQAANLKMNRKIAQQTSKLTSKLPQSVKNVGGGALKLASKAAVPVDVALNVANRKMSGQSWKRSIAGGATETAGGLAGAAGGAALGTAILPGVGTVIGGIGGYMAGSGLAGKAFDTAAGKTPQQLKADQVKNRQRQSGGALTGIGGKTTFDTKKNTMTTGAGSQRKTVKLASTSVVKDPTTGKLDTGYLAYKGGKAVYKRADAPGTGTTNPWERIGRTLNPSAYKQSDELKRQQNLRIAAQNDIKRQQALGVKGSQNLVGPKIVGSPTGYKPAGGGMGGGRGGRK